MLVLFFALPVCCVVWSLPTVVLLKSSKRFVRSMEAKGVTWQEKTLTLFLYNWRVVVSWRLYRAEASVSARCWLTWGIARCIPADCWGSVKLLYCALIWKFRGVYYCVAKFRRCERFLRSQKIEAAKSYPEIKFAVEMSRKVPEKLSPMTSTPTSSMSSTTVQSTDTFLRR